MNLSKDTEQMLIMKLLGLSGDNPSKTLDNYMVGKVCMFRAYSAGVHFGELVKKEGQTCLIKDSRRVFYWIEACSLSQLANDGSKKNSECKIAMPVDEIILEQVIEIIPMKEEAIKNLTEHVWKK